MDKQTLHMEDLTAIMAAMQEETERTNSAMLAILTSMAESLQTLAEAQTSEPPNLQRRLAEYGTFDWSTIGALILETDQDGPTVVEWRGQRFTRRAPQNKYGLAIWFSRAIGKDEDGSVHYARLVTFKEQAEAEPIPRKARAATLAAQPSNGQPDPRPARGQPAAVRDTVGKVVDRAKLAQTVAETNASLAQEWDDLPTHPQSAHQQSAHQRQAIDQDILDAVATLEASKRDQFSGVATPDQYGLWMDLIVPLLADQGDTAALEVTARLAGVPLRTVQQPGWRPAASLCAAWLAWLVAVNKAGQAIRPYRARKDGFTDLHKILEAARTF